MAVNDSWRGVGTHYNIYTDAKKYANARTQAPARTHDTACVLK